MDEDHFRETRRLRASADRTKTQLRSATIGGMVSALCVRYAFDPSFRQTALFPILLVAAPVIFGASLVPYFSARCPKCRQRLHTFWGRVGSANASVCRGCGFELGKHLPTR